jgi:hypothetical protein
MWNVLSSYSWEVRALLYVREFLLGGSAVRDRYLMVQMQKELTGSLLGQRGGAQWKDIICSSNSIERPKDVNGIISSLNQFGYLNHTIMPTLFFPSKL